MDQIPVPHDYHYSMKRQPLLDLQQLTLTNSFLTSLLTRIFLAGQTTLPRPLLCVNLHLYFSLLIDFMLRPKYMRPSSGYLVYFTYNGPRP